jgi:hypothetical protein
MFLLTPCFSKVLLRKANRLSGFSLRCRQNSESVRGYRGLRWHSARQSTLNTYVSPSSKSPASDAEVGSRAAMSGTPERGVPTTTPLEGARMTGRPQGDPLVKKQSRFRE